MRLSAILLRLAVFAIAACVAVLGARATVAFVEDRSVVGVREVLLDRGYEWASVLGDGLQIILEGDAPSEAQRFRAISAAGSIVDASRVIDNMDVVATASIVPPEFAIEILRNDSGVSLIGLIPAALDRDDLIGRIGSAADDQVVTDLLEVADYPAPATFRPAVDYAIRALGELPRSKISVSASRVVVNAITDSTVEKVELETRLRRNQPDNIRVTLGLNAPRPVISPFTTRFTLDADGARFNACAVDSAQARAKITAAAREAGLTGDSGCVEALGVPSLTWGDAVAQAIMAVRDLGGGTVTVADTDVALVALEGTDQDLFDTVVGRLENSLPDVYALASDLPKPPDAGAEGPPRFTIQQSESGAVSLRGRITDDLGNKTANNFAIAKFGAVNVTNSARIVDGLPQGWLVRVLAGIEAMDHLNDGTVTVEPDKITVIGQTGSETAQADISRLLIDKLGESAEFDMNVTYVKALDPVAGLPTPEECIAQITAVTNVAKITFDPGASSITNDTTPVVDEIAEILKKCPELPMQIAGYTDSQGREEMNQQLSQDRATAVLSALRQRRVTVGTFEAVGFGEADPIADNGTEEGREANRRIEFTLITETDATDADPDAAPADEDPATEAAETE